MFLSIAVEVALMGSRSISCFWLESGKAPVEQCSVLSAIFSRPVAFRTRVELPSQSWVDIKETFFFDVRADGS